MGVDKLKLQMLQLLVYIVSLLNLCNGMPQFLIRRTYKVLVTHPIIPDRKELRVKIETRTRRELYCLELRGVRFLIVAFIVVVKGLPPDSDGRSSYVRAAKEIRILNIMLRLLCGLCPCACSNDSLFVAGIRAVACDENAGNIRIYAIRTDIAIIVKFY